MRLSKDDSERMKQVHGMQDSVCAHGDETSAKQNLKQDRRSSNHVESKIQKGSCYSRINKLQSRCTQQSEFIILTSKLKPRLLIALTFHNHCMVLEGI